MAQVELFMLCHVLPNAIYVNILPKPLSCEDLAYPLQIY